MPLMNSTYTCELRKSLHTGFTMRCSECPHKLKCAVLYAQLLLAYYPLQRSLAAASRETMSAKELEEQKTCVWQLLKTSFKHDFICCSS